MTLDAPTVFGLVAGAFALAFLAFMCGAEYGYTRREPVAYLQRDDVEATLRAAQEAPGDIEALSDLLVATPIRLAPRPGTCQYCEEKATVRAINWRGKILLLCALHRAHYDLRCYEQLQEETP